MGQENKVSKKSVCRFKMQMQKMHVEWFLHRYQFEDVNTPQQSSWFSRSERLFPIHVAAMLGDQDMIHFLLEAGASLDQRTSKGRSALDCAICADVDGSHQFACHLLRIAEQVNESELQLLET